MPKIFINGQFYFDLSSKMWSHVFFWNTLYIRDNVHGVDGGWTTSDVGKRRIYDGPAVSFTVAFQQQNTDTSN